MTQFGLPKLNLYNLMLQAKTILQTGGMNPSGPTPPMAPNPYANPQAELLKNYSLTLAKLFQNEQMRLNAQEMSFFLKETLKLPQEIKLLLLSLALESSPAEAKKQINQTLAQIIQGSEEAVAVPMDDLQALLAKNTGEASDKVLKLIQGNQMSQTKGAQQLTELLVSLGKLSDKIKASPAEAMETMMLLYIPWYPLAAQQKLELSFEFPEEEGEGGEKDVSAIVYLQTNAWGRFKIVVNELDPLQVLAKVYHEEVAKELIPRIEEDLNRKLAEDGLPASTFDSETIRPEQLVQPNATSSTPATPEDAEATATAKPELQSGFKRATRQADKKTVTIQPGQQLSLLVLTCAYAMARFIFEADEAATLLQKNR